MSEREHYERAGHWREDGPLSDPDQRHRVERTAELVPTGISSLLDAGCGNGIFLRQLETARPELRLVGLERSGAARSARTCAAPVIGGSVDGLPFPDRAFDLVCALEVIEHLPPGVYERALAELARVADRYVLLSVPWREIRRSTICPACGCRFDPNHHLREFGRRDLPALVPGCRIVRDRRIHIRVFPLPRLLLRLRARRPLPWPGAATCPRCGHREDGAAAPARRPASGYLPRFWRRAKWIAALYERVS